MKNNRFILTTLIVAALFSTAIFTACTKNSNSNTDPCSSVVCLNGGSCSGGTCTCPTGYTGTDCGTVAQSTIRYVNNTFTTVYMTINGNATALISGGSLLQVGTPNNSQTVTANTYWAEGSVIVGETPTWNID